MNDLNESRGMRGMAMGKSRILGMLILIPALANVACVRLHGPKDLRRDLSAASGVRLEREMGFTVTRSGVWLARMGLNMADETPVSLKGVKRVQVGIYTVDGLARGHDAKTPLAAADLLPGWEPIVRVREDGEEVLVLVNQREEEIRGLVVIVAEDDEWVLVRIKGRLDRVVEDAMSMAFDQADRPDLYARSREERGLDPLPENSPETEQDETAPEAVTASWEPEPRVD